MGQIEQLQTGHLLGALDDTNNAGTTAEMDYIKNTGQVVLASSENNPPTKTAYFTRCYDYNNDIIGYLTRESPMRIVVYDIANDVFLYNEEAPKQSTDARNALFFIGNYAYQIERVFGKPNIYRYTFPELVFQDQYEYYQGGSLRIMDCNNTKMFLFDEGASPPGTYHGERLASDFTVEASQNYTFDPFDQELCADQNYIYTMDRSTKQMRRGNLDWTGFANLFVTALTTPTAFIADNGYIYILDGFDLVFRVYNSAGVLQYTFGDAPYRPSPLFLASVAITQNYIAFPSATSFPLYQIRIYDKSDYSFIKYL